MPSKVIIYDDNKARRESLSLLIQSDPELLLVAALPNCNSVLLDMQKFEPAVVLMDIQMPGISGIEAVKLIHHEFPSVKVIMQTVFEDDDKIFESIKNGALGYILKKAHPVKVIEGIKDVLAGDSPVSPSIANKILKYFSSNKTGDNSQHPDFGLTDREKEILALLADGKAYKMIAESCDISIYTVNAHIRKIYEKLHVNSATEAVAKANKFKLLE